MSDNLQFRKAEPIKTSTTDLRATSCAACREPITGEYFQVNGYPVCSGCASRIQEFGNSGHPAVPGLARPILYGGAVALGCSLIYAGVIFITHLEIGILALFIGIAIGKAVRAGAAGVGGRPLQILAVALTYLAIALSSLPLIWSSSGPQPLAVAYALASPFLDLTGNFASAVLSLIILGVGMQRAWVITAPSRILVTGPHKLAAI